MIIDSLDGFARYFPHDAWRRAEVFLRSLRPDTPEGDTPLLGERMFGRVQAYDTRGPEQGVLESHRRYVDIQTVITGAEGIDWYPRESLQVRVPYDAAKDVEFYHRPPGLPPARVDVTPGRWVLLFPEDAHMPQMHVGGRPGHVKKAVIKIEIGLLQATA